MPSEKLQAAVLAYVKKLGGKKAYEERRLKCQTDLWFLSGEIFGRDLYERTHRPVIDFFLKKKPFGPAFDPKSKYSLKEFHEALAEISPLSQRKGLLLWPRGSYKSSIDADDITQYIINYPDIRILVLVGESSLGEAFVPDIKQRFVLEEGREPTEFQLLFPEFVIDLSSDKNKGGESEYWCPARRLAQKEPTLGALSILGSTSGWHSDILKCDDVITDTTPVGDDRQRQKIVRKFITVINLLGEHGILELIGTRYHEEDLYEHIKKTLKGIRYLCGASWIVLPHAIAKKPHELLEGDVWLLFPEKQGFAYLREKLLLDEHTFFLQQLNDPQRTGPVVRFKLEDLRKATVACPQDARHQRYNFWDVATTASTGSDFSVGLFVTVDTDKWVAYVQRMIVDKFAPTELVYQMAKLAFETQPQAVFYEKYPATEMWLSPEIKRVGVSMGVEIPVHAFKTDKTKVAKGHRIAGIEPLISGGRLFFNNTIPNIEMLYQQFTQFTGEPTGKRHDDIPDAVSFIRQVMPVTGLDLPTPQTPEMPRGLQMLDNAASNAAWQAAQAKDPALQAFLRQGQSTQSESIALEEKTGNPYFPIN